MGGICIALHKHMHKLVGLHDTMGSVRPRRDTQRPCSTLSHMYRSALLHSLMALAYCAELLVLYGGRQAGRPSQLEWYTLYDGTHMMVHINIAHGSSVFQQTEVTLAS
jgi:hypothetical protein